MDNLEVKTARIMAINFIGEKQFKLLVKNHSRYNNKLLTEQEVKEIKKLVVEMLPKQQLNTMSDIFQFVDLVAMLYS